MIIPALTALFMIFVVREITDSKFGLKGRQAKMLRKFKITYITVTGKEKTEKIEASSKYDAKNRFYRLHPKYEIIKVEEVPG
jgi:hypothetical protein